MFNISNVNVVPLENSKFIHPIKIKYQQNGIKKEWEAIKAHDSVAILLYHVEKNSLLLVKQFRPPVYLTKKSHCITFELCAGILDKDISPIETVKEEIYEECGYDVKVENIEKITSFYTSVGIAGTHQILYYSEIDESMKKHEGGGIDNEEIELVYLPVEKINNFIFDEKKPKTSGLIASFFWFLSNKLK